jgi:hypothetical protein
MLNFFSSNGRNEKRRTNPTTNDRKGEKEINMFTKPHLIRPGSVVWLPLHEATTCKGGEGCLYTGIRTKFVHSKKRPHIIAQVYFNHYVAIPITSYGKRGLRGVSYQVDLPFHTRVRDSAENWVNAGSNVDTPQESEVVFNLGPDNMSLYVIIDVKHTKKPMLQRSFALMASPVTYDGNISFEHLGWLDEDSKKRFSARYKKLSDGLKGLGLQHRKRHYSSRLSRDRRRQARFRGAGESGH